MTSGSCRSACRSARAKLFVSRSTSRWVTTDFLCGWKNSIGSSTVTMCSSLVALIPSTIAASVVVLPLPVGPVTRTRPLGARVISPTAAGRRSPSRAGTRPGMARNTAPTAPRAKKALPLNRSARSESPKSSSRSLSNSSRASCESAS